MLRCVRRYDSLGLWGVYKEVRNIPEIFEDPVVKPESHWVLRASAPFSRSTCMTTVGGKVQPFLLSVPDLTSKQAVLDDFGVVYIT